MVNRQVWGGTGGRGLGAQNSLSPGGDSQMTHKCRCTASSADPVTEDGGVVLPWRWEEGPWAQWMPLMDFPNNKHLQRRTLRQSPAQRSVRQGARAGPEGAVGPVLKMGRHLSSRGEWRHNA